MKKHVSARTLDKTMDYILSHPDMSDDSFNKLAADPETRKALSSLKALKAIDYKTAFGGSGYLYRLTVLDDGILYFYKKQQERAGFWKGFAAGILSTAAAGIIVNLIAFFFMSTP